ncbi:MAG: fibronectin type III domain-containing protein [Candidatus Nanopelagicales bacterium]
MVWFQWKSVWAALWQLAACAAALMLLITVAHPATAKNRREPKPLFPANRAVLNLPQFQWRPVSGAVTYRLEVAVDHKFTNIAYSVDTAATRYMDTTAWPAASYWWRVKVIAPYEGSYSNVRSFTRRWLGPHTGATDVARPDNVVVDDFAAEPGIQVPGNALKISWDPVPDASYYEVQFDGQVDMVCTTPHTALTPYSSGSIGDGDKSNVCNPKLEQGVHWLRVRAVDVTVADAKIFSLWSDEARSLEAAVPSPVVFTLGPNLTGPDDAQPAALTRPRNGLVFLDMPTFEWEPVAWASEYELVLALDQDFTNVIGRFRTTNTRLIPTGRLPENTAVRSYYWFVLPCTKADGKTVSCLNENRAVNRQGKFRSFKKQSVLVKSRKTVRRKTPWVEFTWEAYTTTMTRFTRRTGTAGSSTGGIKWYEMQVRSKGASWDSARTINTDLPATLPTDLRLGGRFQWRVRPVDETGQARPWSNTRFVRTRSAVPANPVALKAFRSRTRVTLLWRTPRARYFPVTSYSVYYSTNGKRWKPLTNVTKHRAAFRVRKGTPYWFMVTANNSAGESAPSRVFVRR